MSAPRRVDGLSLAQSIAARTDRAGVPNARVGQVTGIDASTGAVTVSVQGNDRTDYLYAASPLAVGDTVNILDDVVLGPVVAKAPPIQGTVASVPTNSAAIIVTTSTGTVSAFFLAAYTPTVGDVVYLDWLGTQPIAIGKAGKTGTPPAPDPVSPPAPKPPPPQPPQLGSTTFAASSCGTYRVGDGWRDDANGDVIQGTSDGYPGLNSGAWFYGGRVKATLSGATVTGAQIWLGRTSGGTYAAQPVHVQRVGHDARPAGTLSFTGSATDVAVAVGQTGWFTIPASLAQSLVDSGGSIGIQAASGPYARMFGLSKSGQAGALKISWRR